MSVTVYSMPNCPQCAATYKLLDRNQIEYEVIDLTMNAGAFETVKNLGYLKAPVVVTDTEHWAGFRPDKIKAYAAATLVGTVLL